ncbi:cell number regulator 2-like [Zingiber officinale]|uniref:Uncharacterized protein n=1 Tax=Zingiber officinale TaxID=94328 RepID=A0A8J5CCF8_ZINOF|nr:cell number regulator 2-like [Zingiber officinale]KAG6471004.1 hypothetical protein ZIOFF_072095 [Zingiber officinale]
MHPPDAGYPYPPPSAPGVYSTPPVTSVYPPPFQSPQSWSTGLFDCTSDCTNCVVTLFCPCITFGRIAEILDRGSAPCGLSGALYALLQYLTWFHWVYSCTYRTKMRAQYSLADAPCSDCLVHCCCEQCALCQEYRELNNRDFDMFIGWHANMERRATAAAVYLPPVTPDAMLR